MQILQLSTGAYPMSEGGCSQLIPVTTASHILVKQRHGTPSVFPGCSTAVNCACPNSIELLYAPQMKLQGQAGYIDCSNQTCTTAACSVKYVAGRTKSGAGEGSG